MPRAQVREISTLDRRVVTADAKILARRGWSLERSDPLLNMSRDELGHLEHAHLALAIEDCPERIVGIDHRSLLFILKTVLLNVVPKLFRKLGAGKWC
jgi:hypothetical protein